MPNSNNALLSVYNKQGIIDFAEGLHDLGWNIYASGGTAKQVERAGVPVIDVEKLERLGIPLLGAVCVDMYPLRIAVDAGSSEQEVIEKIDVDSPTMLLSAAKDRRIVLSQQQQRQPVLDWLRAGRPDEENVLRTLAAVAEQEVAGYIAESAKYLGALTLRSEPQSIYDQFLRQGIRSSALTPSQQE